MAGPRKIFLYSLLLSVVVVACEMRDTDRVEVRDLKVSQEVWKDPDPPGKRLAVRVEEPPSATNQYSALLTWNGWLNESTKVYRAYEGGAPEKIAENAVGFANGFEDKSLKAGKYIYYLEVSPLGDSPSYESSRVSIEVPLDLAIEGRTEAPAAPMRYGKIVFSERSSLVIPKKGAVLVADELYSHGGEIVLNWLDPRESVPADALYISAKRARGGKLQIYGESRAQETAGLQLPLVYVRVDKVDDGFDILGPSEIVSGCLRMVKRVGRNWEKMGCPEMEKHFERELLKKNNPR